MIRTTPGSWARQLEHVPKFTSTIAINITHIHTLWLAHCCFSTCDLFAIQEIFCLWHAHVASLLSSCRLLSSLRLVTQCQNHIIKSSNSYHTSVQRMHLRNRDAASVCLARDSPPLSNLSYGQVCRKLNFDLFCTGHVVCMTQERNAARQQFIYVTSTTRDHVCGF